MRAAGYQSTFSHELNHLYNGVDLKTDNKFETEISKDSEWHLKLNVGNDFLTESINASELKILFDEEQESLEIGEQGRT